ncbi:class I SAM-dependent methyltransferase [Actinosynnema sp. NPDC047251]|uniref:Methyltransferase n=1 Tax=Saccharothrix espanaensis (strain ATCC 51144 / DSM 44229 / JCM 9112 / NBRC 15066 / NRRL 15764) TaxID=1179773 RepID=K0K641_SACES|nr:class I SAM-dependent methyltransferase [Saccharothrix espanaensis]CCH32354.1 Methyltransferase [Saccharothrix espanaensis DSM 44229]
MTEITAGTVSGAFDTSARGYDRLVGLNPGYHAALRASARALRLPERGRGARVLDLGCGTGASTAALVEAAPEAEVVAVDASAGMLAAARRKRWPDRVEFVHSRAEDLAAAGVRGPFDAVFAAYLVRNLPEPDPVLRHVRALLKPGAPFVVLDYAIANSALRRAVWTAVCWSVVIPAGWAVTGDRGLYTYLWRSALDFDDADAFRDRLRRAGFTGVRRGSAGGWQRGITHTFLGRAPERG